MADALARMKQPQIGRLMAAINQDLIEALWPRFLRARSDAAVIGLTHATVAMLISKAKDLIEELPPEEQPAVADLARDLLAGAVEVFDAEDMPKAPPG